MTSQLPGARAPIAGNEPPTPEYYRFLDSLQRLQSGSATASDIAALQAQITAIQAEIDALPSGQGYPTLLTTAPLTTSGLLQNGFAQLGINTLNSVVVNGSALQLSGDAAAPGNTYFYGTDGSGAKGFVQIGSVLYSSSSVDLTINADGSVTFALPLPTGDLSGAWPGSEVVSTHLAAPLPVAQGGTAAASLTAHAVLLGEGTAALGEATTGTAGRVLIDQGASADPAFEAVSGDATLSATGAVQVTGTHLAAPLPIAQGGTSAATAASALAALGALALPDPGYISGLKMAWVSGTQVTVGTGAAYIQSAGSILQVPTAITVTCSGLTASTFYHLYLWNNAGTPSIEYSTTAPASPYFGTASSKTGDTSRRYVGSVLTDSGSNVYGFAHAGNDVFYEAPIAGSPFAVAISTFPSATTISCSGIVPVSGRSIFLNVINNDTTHTVVLGNSTIALSTSVYFELVGSGAGGTTVATHIPLDAAQSFTALQTSGASSPVALRVKGYTYER